MTEYRWTVTSEERGILLSAFIRKRSDGMFSSKKIKRALAKNYCEVNDRIERFSSYVLLPGDAVFFDDTLLFTAPQDIVGVEDSRILFEDDYLVIYNKPANITTNTPGGLHEMLQLQWPTVRIVHRLDRDTTGAIVFPKTEEALLGLEKLFRNREVHKEYIAIADGIPEEEAGCVVNTLGKLFQKGDFVVWGQKSRAEGGVGAVTEWKAEATGGQATLFRCFPKSGRTHQIRIHLSDMRHPILGDSRYGHQHRFKSSYRAPRCLLHAHRLRFPHPCKDEAVAVEAPYPNDIQHAIKELM